MSNKQQVTEKTSTGIEKLFTQKYLDNLGTIITTGYAPEWWYKNALETGIEFGDSETNKTYWNKGIEAYNKLHLSQIPLL